MFSESAKMVGIQLLRLEVIDLSEWNPIGVKCPNCGGEIVENRSIGQRCENNCKLNRSQLSQVLRQQGAYDIYVPCKRSGRSG